MSTSFQASLALRVPAIERLTRPWIDGAFVDPLSSDTFPRVSPVNGEPLPRVAACGAADIDRAVRVARRAFEESDWRRRRARDRKVILQRVAAALLDHKDELAALQTVEMGKPISDAIWEVEYSAETLGWFAEAVDHLYDQVAPLGWAAHATISREPIGVVGAITPWNYPLLMPVVKLGPALATGNTMVVKPAEQTPLVALRLAEIAAEAGLPPGVLNVVPGTGEAAGDALARHLDVDAIGFTGSTAVGRIIMRTAAESNLKKVQLELGGKSPSIVLADAVDPAEIAARTASAIFGNAGQMCDASSRLVVHESLVDAIVGHLCEAAAQWQPGDPFDPATRMGAIVDERQMTRILDYIASSRSEGAATTVGGGRAREESGGYFVQPTVLRDVTNQMRVAREEVFGPVLSVISFSSEEDALRIANDTPYGLAAGVWTHDITKAHRMAKELRAGTVLVNGDELFDPTLPHGGYKQSGMGRDYSHHAFDTYTQLKTTYINLS